MAYQKGSDMLLKVDTTGSSNFVTVGGIQTPRFSIRRGDADVTNQSSSNKWRELLEGAGIISMSVSGQAVLDSAAPQPTLMSLHTAGTHRAWQLVIPGLGTFQGNFQITQLDFSGPHDKEVSMDISLESAGALTFTAA
jgi:TP901-1 family phage major tail protein